FLHAVIRGIDLSADALLAQFRNNLVEVLDVVLGHWNTYDLVWCQPCWESASVVFQQHAEEARSRTKERAVDHNWLLLGTIRSGVLEIEALWHVEVQLHGRHLPGTANRVPCVNRDLRAVEGSAFWAWNRFKTRLSSTTSRDSR